LFHPTDYTGVVARGGAPRIRVMDFDAQEMRGRVLESIDEAYAYASRHDSLTWIDIDGVHDTKLIARLGELAGIHPLVQEDIAHVGQRVGWNKRSGSTRWNRYACSTLLTLEVERDIVHHQDLVGGRYGSLLARRGENAA